MISTRRRNLKTPSYLQLHKKSSHGKLEMYRVLKPRICLWHGHVSLHCAVPGVSTVSFSCATHVMEKKWAKSTYRTPQCPFTVDAVTNIQHCPPVNFMSGRHFFPQFFSLSLFLFLCLFCLSVTASFLLLHCRTFVSLKFH